MYVRSLGDFVVLVVTLVSMYFQDAPLWSLTLAVFVGTRAFSLAVSMDLATLQQSIRKTREETVPAARVNVEKKKPPL